MIHFERFSKQVKVILFIAIVIVSEMGFYFLNLKSTEQPLHLKKNFDKRNKINDKYGILRSEAVVKFEVCKTFKFSPADWTLYELMYYDEKLENETCRQLHNEIFQPIDLLYEGKIQKQTHVKWIVNLNGTITNLGCTKHTKMCVPGAFFDKKRNMRIDTPPCCRKHLMKQLDLVSTELNKNNISYTLAGGYVIGYARRKEMLHYDEDIDLFIEKKYWRSPSFMRFFNELSKKYGYVQLWGKPLSSMSLLVSNTNNNGLGMWSYYRDPDKPDNIRVYNFATPPYDYRIIEPTRLVKMNGIKTKIPNKIYVYLNETFGKGKWENELLCKKKDLRKCIG